jgi:hypothetical protein
MGTWGSGPFDNDDASDWAWSLTDSADERVLDAALREPLTDGALSAPDAQIALAAAHVVATSLDGRADGLPHELVTWVRSHPSLPWPDLAALAVEAVDRVRASSGLHELWAASGDAAEWEADLAELRGRLSQM